MDFKVAGTTQGVTAIQMDVKVSGVPVQILAEALEQAKVARLHILDKMVVELATPREHISPRAPQIVVVSINPEQIGMVIGSGGKVINAIKDETGVEDISIEEDGTIYITGKHGTAEVARERIEKITRVYAVGEKTTATIVKVTDFGAFARLDNDQEGLIHISEIAPFRLETMEGAVEVREVVPVIISKIDKGKIGLSIKQADPEFAVKKGLSAEKN
jgi:polyribonucleotide nucleotidyltransferase